MAHNWYAVCPKCKERFMKREMKPLFVSETRYHPPKILCYLCTNCFLEILDEWEIGM